MKPPGIAFGLRDGSLHVGVTHPSRAEDKVWEAVEEALLEGWTVAQFLHEVRSAWEDAKQRELKSDMDDFEKAR